MSRELKREIPNSRLYSKMTDPCVLSIQGRCNQEVKRKCPRRICPAIGKVSPKREPGPSQAPIQPRTRTIPTQRWENWLGLIMD